MTHKKNMIHSIVKRLAYAVSGGVVTVYGLTGTSLGDAIEAATVAIAAVVVDGYLTYREGKE